MTYQRDRVKQRRYEKTRLLAIDRGTWVDPFVPVDETRHHIQQLRDIGYGYASIARLADVNVKTVRDIARGHSYAWDRDVTRIRRDVAVKILTVTLDDTELSDTDMVDSAATLALVADLRQRGWATYRIATEAGLGACTRFDPHRRRIQARTARRIEALHAAVTRSKRERLLDIAELELLIGTDHPESIARRLGYKNLASLERVLDRHDRRDLFHRLRRTIQNAA